MTRLKSTLPFVYACGKCNRLLFSSEPWNGYSFCEYCEGTFCNQCEHSCPGLEAKLARLEKDDAVLHRLVQETKPYETVHQVAPDVPVEVFPIVTEPIHQEPARPHVKARIKQVINAILSKL